MDRASELDRDRLAVVGENAEAAQAQTFEDLFEAEHERLFRALYLVTGNAQEAEEVMQDAFLKIWERWERVRAMENPAGYLCRTAVNGALSRRRRVAVAAKRTFSPGPAEDPFAATDLHDELVGALRTLTPRQRAALMLTDLLGYPAEEAAQTLGVAAGTIRSLASQGRAAMRTAMEARDD
jgi:RNA polymerase sigma-70 factor, ECF subfamily